MPCWLIPVNKQTKDPVRGLFVLALFFIAITAVDGTASTAATAKNTTTASDDNQQDEQDKNETGRSH